MNKKEKSLKVLRILKQLKLVRVTMKFAMSFLRKLDSNFGVNFHFKILKNRCILTTLILSKQHQEKLSATRFSIILFVVQKSKYSCSTSLFLRFVNHVLLQGIRFIFLYMKYNNFSNMKIYFCYKWMCVTYIMYMRCFWERH